jgi:hypothetical protein
MLRAATNNGRASNAQASSPSMNDLLVSLRTLRDRMQGMNSVMSDLLVTTARDRLGQDHLRGLRLSREVPGGLRPVWHFFLLHATQYFRNL